MLIKPLVRALLVSALSAGCEHPASPAADDPSTAPPPPSTPQAGRVRGRVLDSEGRPAANVTIIVDNTIYFNSAITGRTDANGRYDLETPIGSWRVYAWKQPHAYNGRSYKVTFAPDNPDSFAGVDGAVRNFEWKLSGRDPYHPDQFLGGTVMVGKDGNSELYDVENLEFTLTPAGPRIDGSAGQVLRLRTGAPHTSWYSYLTDVPIGRYTVTAVHRTTGRPVLLRDPYKGDDYAPEMTLDFFGTESPRGCTNCAHIDYREP